MPAGRQEVPERLRERDGGERWSVASRPKEWFKAFEASACEWPTEYTSRRAGDWRDAHVVVALAERHLFATFQKRVGEPGMKVVTHSHLYPRQTLVLSG